MDKMLYRFIVSSKFYSSLKQISRFYCQTKVKPDISLCVEEFPKLSTLFVPGRYGADIYQIVKPVIDVKYIADNLVNLKFSCDQRGIQIDLENVLKTAEEWLHIRERYLAVVEESRESITKLHRSTSIGNENTFQVLNEKKSKLFEKVGMEKLKLHDIEDVVMPLFQKIPHTLHADTPLQLNVVEMCQESPSHKSEASFHSHIAKNLLYFTNNPIVSYYMTGKLADLDFAIQLYFVDKLNSLDFSPLSCMDFCKSFIIEAIGYDPYSSIKIKEKDSHEVRQKLHLVGGASFEAFCAYLSNMNINKAILPMKYFSVGRRYNAVNKENNSQDLFSSVQSTNVHYIVLSESSSQNLFDDLLKTIKEWYSELNIPFRVVNIAAKNLTLAESQRKQLELWSPALNDYVPVAYISQHDDFVSKRLQITYGIECIKEGYCHIIEGTFVNIPVLVGCIVENFQTSNFDFNIPPVLKKYLFLQE